MGYPAITRKQAQKLANELILSREANKDLLTIFPEFESTFIEWREGPEYGLFAYEWGDPSLN